MHLRKSALYLDSGLWLMKSVFERTCTFSPVQKQPQNFDMSIKIWESSLLSFVQLDRHCKQQL